MNHALQRLGVLRVLERAKESPFEVTIECEVIVTVQKLLYYTYT